MTIASVTLGLWLRVDDNALAVPFTTRMVCCVSREKIASVILGVWQRNFNNALAVSFR